MRRAFLHTLQTPAVETAQAAAYGRARPVPSPDGEPRGLGPDERAFIAARDSFYLATVGETGWPYVQHRGGPRGFLHVLDDTHVAFADVRGNRQLLSTGNLATNDRAALFLMDYPARERLKLIGHVRVRPAAEAAALLPAAAIAPGAVVERVFVVRVTGFDWNCSQHITPRYTLEEVEQATQPLRERIAELEARLDHGRAAAG